MNERFKNPAVVQFQRMDVSAVFSKFQNHEGICSNAGEKMGLLLREDKVDK